MVIPLALAAYGVAKGILYLVIKDSTPGSANQQGQNTTPQPTGAGVKERMKPEQIAGITIVILSVITELIQAIWRLLMASHPALLLKIDVGNSRDK